jgi:hypothetical protein
MTSIFNSLFLFVLAIAILSYVTNAQSDGWKMTDRFYGFRYELVGSNLDNTILEKVQAEADNYFCFGWTQLSPMKTIVGEARCSKARGPIFQDKLKQISNLIQRADILVSGLRFSAHLYN